MIKNCSRFIRRNWGIFALKKPGMGTVEGSATENCVLQHDFLYNKMTRTTNRTMVISIVVLVKGRSSNFCLLIF